MVFCQPWRNCPGPALLSSHHFFMRCFHSDCAAFGRHGWRSSKEERKSKVPNSNFWGEFVHSLHYLCWLSNTLKNSFRLKSNPKFEMTLTFSTNSERTSRRKQQDGWEQNTWLAYVYHVCCSATISKNEQLFPKNEKRYRRILSQNILSRFFSVIIIWSSSLAAARFSATINIPIWVMPLGKSC